MVGQALSDLWGSPVVIENRPGAAGNIATEVTAKAPPDGYTLVLCNIGSHAVTPARFAKKLTYDPIRDFAFPSMIGGVPNLFMVHPSFPAKTLKQFIAYAKANPGKSELRLIGRRCVAPSLDRAAQADDGDQHRSRAV